MALEKATITNLLTGQPVPVMFNPAEYSLDLGNNFAEIGIPGIQTPPIQYVRGSTRSLKMELFFDTTAQRVDVRSEIRRVTELLDPDLRTQGPPILLFSWGGLNFKCVLESVGQRFTVFLENGTPVRATLTVSFKEYQPLAIEIKQGLFVGPPTVRSLIQGETLSKVAGEFLGDPGAWREIAVLNNIDDPRNPPTGVPLIMPPRRTRGLL